MIEIFILTQADSFMWWYLTSHKIEPKSFLFWMNVKD